MSGLLLLKQNQAAKADLDHPGFAHTVLVDIRARLARSERPTRVFPVTCDAARDALLVSAKRVLDPTPLYDTVAMPFRGEIVPSG